MAGKRPSTQANALTKMLKSMKPKTLKYIAVKRYSKGMEVIKRKARSNAPKESGKLRSSIDKKILKGRSSKSGSLLKARVFSNVIYDKVNARGIPDSKLSASEARDRSRRWRGRNHKLRAGQNYARTTKKKSGGTRSGSRTWAFGRRSKNSFMTRGQRLREVNNQIAKEIGADIVNALAKSLRAYQ